MKHRKLKLCKIDFNEILQTSTTKNKNISNVTLDY
jgi:hypothetical protein